MNPCHAVFGMHYEFLALRNEDIEKAQQPSSECCAPQVEAARIEDGTVDGKPKAGLAVPPHPPVFFRFGLPLRSTLHRLVPSDSALEGHIGGTYRAVCRRRGAASAFRLSNH